MSYSFDEWNRLKTVTDLTDNDQTTYFYDGVNNLIRTEFPNGIIETREYDDLDRLLVLENALGDTILSSYTYTLDKVGHRKVVQELDGRIVAYDYDDLYRLREEKITDPNDSANDGRIISYTYDNVGNRLTKVDSAEGITTYVYDDNDRLLTEQRVKDGGVVESIVYSYDDNGNTTARLVNGTEETIYVWNDDGRLVQVILPDGTELSYEYDVDGIRVSATKDGVTTEYLVDKNLPYAQVLEEYINGQLQVRYIHGHDLIEQERNGDESIYLVDGLGSTRVLTDENGNVSDMYDYEAFGELINSAGESENSYRFAGEQFANTLDAYYLRQRYYEQETGRFTQRDNFEGLISIPMTLHKYIYANSNPVMFVDPSGNITILQRFAVAASIAATLSNISIGTTYGILRHGVNNGSFGPNEERWVECMDDRFGWALALGSEILKGVAGSIPKHLVNQPVAPGKSAFTSLARILSTNRILRPLSTTYADWLKGRVGIFKGTGIKPAAVVNLIYLGASSYVLYTAVSCAVIANSDGVGQ